MNSFLRKVFIYKHLMQTLFTGFLLIGAIEILGQTVLFSENVGNPAGTTDITSYTGWQNNGTYSYSGSGDVRSTTASSGYTGASGNGNVFLTSSTGATFEISGINTSSYSSISISFGAYKSTAASSMSELVLEYSIDGVVYTAISIPAQPTGAGTAIWRLITISNSIPSTTNLRLRWTNTSAAPQFRIDDISLSYDNVINVGSISQNSFTLDNCSSTASFNINFTSTGTFTGGNTYTAQLSDASGLFASPVSIGTLSSTANSGTIPATIPAGTLTGSGYNVRVVSSSPAVTGTTYGTAISVTQNGYCASNSTDYFRSRQTGNWATASTWQSSNDNTNWITATLAPTSSANAITIQNGHTVTMAANASADQLTINSGGTLVHNNGVTFTLNDDAGIDMSISGTYVIFGSIPSGTGTYSVLSGGMIQADGNAGGTADGIAFSSNTRVTFNTGSIFNWNTTLSFSSSGITYFPNTLAKPIFRISSAMGNVGGGSNTYINGLLEVNGSVTWDNAGTKTFRDGIIGSGTLNQATGGGAFLITANDAQLGGTGAINLNSTSGLQISSGAIVTMISDKIVNGSTNDFTVANGGRFNCGTYILSGTADFVLASGGTLGIGSTAGINTSGASGNIQVSGYRYFSSGANYIYNGSANQSTGTFTTEPTANTVNDFYVSSSGTSGNNTVTLSSGNNNLTANKLYLNQGYFAAGSGQNFQIANNGIVYGNGGANPDDPTAGNIVFLGLGYTNGISAGNPYLYSVIIDDNGVDFNGNPNTNSATIMNRLQINSNGYVIDAPYYQSGSALVYNTGGTYGRSVEWGSASNQGYPHHVTVQGNTTVNLFSNPISPDELSMGGDLTLGNSNGYGRVNLNNGMSKPLSVGGNLIIGTSSVTSQNSQLNLSSGNGGDLWLDGDFTRYPNGEYNDNSRAIFFKGNSNASINTPNVTISPGVPTQNFSYLLMQKTTSSADVTLNCPVGIYNQLTLTSGTITTTNTNLLVMVDNSTVSGGSDASFVNGPMKKIGNDAFVFPVGKSFATNPLSGASVGGHHIIGISAPSGTSEEFIAEYYLGNANLIGPITASGLVRVSACEYWRLERNGSSNVNVTLSWNSRSNCNVGYVTDLSTLVVAHNSATTSGGTAPFTGGNWDSYGRNTASGTTGPAGAGTITWNNVSTFSPFALGSTDQNDNPLPFNLNRFNATPARKNIQLDWAVGNNHEQQSYTLERSKDGIHFEAITHVAALKDVTVAEYNYADEQPLTGWNYYRLRATDNQLKQATSRIIRIWWGQGPAVISVLPNPASEKIIINLSDPSSITEIQIVNSTGQVVKQTRSVQFSNEVNVSSLQAGMYYIRLFGKNGLTTKSFVKQ